MAVLCVVTAVTSRAQTFKSLFSFNFADGEGPGYGSLVQGTDGNLYGVTSSGAYGYGTFFRITPGGAKTTLYWFGYTGSPNGAYPEGLTLGTDENFYGTTTEGGTGTSCGGSGCGTIFKISQEGMLTSLHSFDSTDGAYPTGTLIEGSDGDFYGTTQFGGSSTACPNIEGGSGCGTIFRITPDGVLTTLHSFDSTDGWDPIAGLLEGNDGNLYGTTIRGGANGDGTVFKISRAGLVTTLHSFCAQANCADGADAYAPLIQGSDGDLYGTTAAGGSAMDSCVYGEFGGTIFKITPEGALTTLYSFCDVPFAPLLHATDGNLYGTAAGGLAAKNCPAYYTDGCGTVFKIAPGDVVTVLHTFNFIDGASPEAGLTQATSGVFYGTTIGGGNKLNRDCDTYGCGTVFSENVGLGPFVTTLPSARKAGTRVAILGYNLTGATQVTFNGVPASFAVVSDTEIAATVPSNATTGTVQVVTPGGTLSSNVPFRVIP